MPQFQLLDLFSGIGAFSLGLERSTAFKTTAFCEIDPFCRRVLARHWPEVPCYDDIRTLTAGRLRADGISVDAICGGFPCQDISIAGRGAGIEGERSGLWREYARLIGELRPRYVLVENVAALLGRGLSDVLGDLAALGYDAEWHCIPAAAVGAPHRRDRVWIVAYPERKGLEGGAWRGVPGSRGASVVAACRNPDVAYPTGERERPGGYQPAGDAGDRQLVEGGAGTWRDADDHGEAMADADDQRRLQPQGRLCDLGRRLGDSGWWLVESDVGRVVDGTADKVDRRRRLIGLGNSLVPQIPELLGRAILAADDTR